MSICIRSFVHCVRDNFRIKRRLIKRGFCRLRAVARACFINQEKAHASYSVVSACYNVEKYVDEFIESIVHQSVGFKNIELIMVDDGSTDGTAKKIEEWQKRYPRIRLIRKKNGGASSARNVGLSVVTNRWVNFADPDDYFEYDAFERVDAVIGTVSTMCMVACRVQPFRESDYSNWTAPLDYKFSQEVATCSVKAMGRNYQLSAASTFFCVDRIRELKLSFSEQCRPNFEDARFICEYLCGLSSEMVGFVRRAVYFYRKRQDKSSLIDKSWTRPEKFSTVLKFGYLAVIKHYKEKLGYVTNYVQGLVAYDLSWYFSYLLNHDERTRFLSDEQRHRFLSLIGQCFEHISEDVILESRLELEEKLGVLQRFKGIVSIPKTVDVIDVDEHNRQIKLRYHYAGELPEEKFLLNGKSLVVPYANSVSSTWMGRTLYFERIVWVQLPESCQEEDLFSVFLGVETPQVVVRTRAQTRHAIGTILTEFKRTIRHNASPLAHCWIIMDRDTQADDNGEHLYRYLMHCKTKHNIVFALRHSSHDWDRLHKEGFHLVDYGSGEHRKAFDNCDVIISSHADWYVVRPFRERCGARPRFVFLQHGVTKDNLSEWLNPKGIDLIVAASQPEYISLVDGSHYRLTRKEVCLTGLARYDRLLQRNAPIKRIVVMPTWRSRLVGKLLKKTVQREFSPEFMSSNYARMWQSLLCSEKLRSVAKAAGYEIVFFPHANVQRYLPYFALPKDIKVLSHKDLSIQELFGQGAVLITDYSSVAFDFAYLKKPILYYQFDRDEVFNEGGHTYQRGYFNYERDGFGDVCLTEDAVIDSLEGLLADGAKLPETYRARIDKTFAQWDGKCCERILAQIETLVG